MDVVVGICNLPVSFKTRNVSIYQLVAEAGYVVTPKALTVEAVTTYLWEHLELISEWLGYSEDQRRSSGWHITPRSLADETFEVAYFPTGPRIVVAGRVRACAEFIVREVRSIAE